MLKVRWHGVVFAAAPLRPVSDGTGDWLMTAHGHAPRVSPGATIRVRVAEIIDGSPEDFGKILQAPGNEEAMSANSLAEKMQQLAGAPDQLANAMEGRVDDLLARKNKVQGRFAEVAAQHQEFYDKTEKGIDALESALRPLSNEALKAPGQ